MKIRFPFRRYLIRLIASFFLGALLIGTAFYYSLDTKLRPTPEETISLFVAASPKEDKSHEAWSLLKDSLSDSILQFDLYAANPKDSNFQMQYQYRGRSSDVVILPFDLLNDDLSLFWDIPNKDAYQGKGVLVHSLDGTTDGMGDYFVYEQKNYYAFFNVSSLHVSSLDASKKDDEAIRLLKGFLGHSS